MAFRARQPSAEFLEYHLNRKAPGKRGDTPTGSEPGKRPPPKEGHGLNGGECYEKYPSWLYNLAGVSGVAFVVSVFGGLLISLLFPAIILPAVLIASVASAGLALSGFMARRYQTT
jgi:hypothetical protein